MDDTIANRIADSLRELEFSTTQTVRRLENLDDTLENVRDQLERIAETLGSIAEKYNA